jgi:hypothetical protein
MTSDDGEGRPRHRDGHPEHQPNDGNGTSTGAVSAMDRFGRSFAVRASLAVALADGGRICPRMAASAVGDRTERARGGLSPDPDAIRPAPLEEVTRPGDGEAGQEAANGKEGTPNHIAQQHILRLNASAGGGPGALAGGRPEVISLDPALIVAASGALPPRYPPVDQDRS